jgi:hypothetical protein
MTKFEDWPLWLQVSVGVPHAILAGLLAWVWTPTGKRGLYWALGLCAYLFLFYLVFVPCPSALTARMPFVDC